MRDIKFFVEDSGHEVVLTPFLQRFASLYNVQIEIENRSATGGHGRVISELKKYLHELERGKETVADLLVIATDGNCKGYLERMREMEEIAKKFRGSIVYAIPDPHIERWLLLDSAAFKKVLGKGCSAPVQKCERSLYKRILIESVRNAGFMPIAGGLEYAEQLVNEMDLDKLERTEDSLGRFLKALRQKFQEWERVDKHS
jgi:hypothetical protein